MFINKWILFDKKNVSNVLLIDYLMEKKFTEKFNFTIKLLRLQDYRTCKNVCYVVAKKTSKSCRQATFQTLFPNQISQENKLFY